VEQLKLLWQLQELEQEIARKEIEMQNIPSVSAYRVRKREMAALQDTLSCYAEKMEAARKKMRRAELDLHNINGAIADLNKKLYGGAVHNTRELEGMEKKVLSMKTEQSAIEDNILSIMEELEKDEFKSSELDRETDMGQERLQQVKIQAQKDMQLARQELEELNRRREGITQRVEAPLLQKYRELKAKMHGQCISLVLNSFCGICNVSLPSAFRARILTPGQLIFCENCGSLLVLGD